MGNTEQHFEEGEFQYNSDESTLFVQACAQCSLKEKHYLKKGVNA